MSDWSLLYDDYDPAQEGLREALCTLGNGYFATRGAAPDSVADDVHYPGTYLAGGYNRLITEIAGREIENEDLVNLPNWLPLAFRIDGRRLVPPGRRRAPRLPPGARPAPGAADAVAALPRRRGPHHALGRAPPRQHGTTATSPALAVRVTPENWSGRLTVRVALDGRSSTVACGAIARSPDATSRRSPTAQPEDDVIFLQSRTVQSRLEIALAARTRCYLDGQPLRPERRTRDTGRPRPPGDDASSSPPAGRSCVEKLVALYTSREPAHRRGRPRGAQEGGRTRRRFDALLADAPARLAAPLGAVRHRASTTAADGAVAATLRLHIFHLLQTVSYHTIDLDVGVPRARLARRGLSRPHLLGRAVHLPVSNLAHPGAHPRAAALPLPPPAGGAPRCARRPAIAAPCTPGRAAATAARKASSCTSIRVSGRWIPDVSHRQRHISAAIAYNVWQYYQATDDHEFLCLLRRRDAARDRALLGQHRHVRRRRIDRYEILRRDGPGRVPHRAIPTAPDEPAASTTTPTPTSWRPGCSPARSMR